MPIAPPDRSSYHHGDLRASLVEAAARLLEIGGAAGLSLRQVAREAGVSPAAPYRHFRDKHELLEAVAAAGFRALESRLDTVLATFPNQPRKQILEACRVYVDETLKLPERSNLMFGGFLDPSRRSTELATAIRESFAKLVATVRRGEGDLYRDVPIREVVVTLWSATHGLALLAAAGQLRELDGSDPRTLIERTVEHVLVGLARA